MLIIVLKVELIILCAIVYLASSARILGIFQMPAYSHYQLGDCIFKELAARGHKVTVISPFEMKERVENMTHVVITGLVDKIVTEDIIKHFYKESDRSILMRTITAATTGHYFTELTLNHTNVQNLLQSDQKFDLVIQDFYENDAFLGFANYYKVPHIGVSTQGATDFVNLRMGNPHNPSYISEQLLSYPRDMNFLQRMVNTAVFIGNVLYRHFYVLPKHNEILQRYFSGSPHLFELYYKTSLVLLNSHVATHNPVPLSPTMIEIGGYHVRPPKVLPEDIQNYLDNAPEGVILFSLGSVIRSKDMPIATRNAILKVFGEQKLKVVWKWEDDALPGQPANVKLVKWLPQQDMLAHPNIKVFITHGGLLGLTEAIYNGVPIIGLPISGDQDLNIETAEHAGIGIKLPFNKVNEDTLRSALDEILNNPKYFTNVKKRSQILRDRPQKPLDTAMYWIEYVLRHNGAPHLQSTALKLSWYQNLLLDCILVLTLMTSIVFYVTFKVLRMICNKKHSAKKKQKET